MSVWAKTRRVPRHRMEPEGESQLRWVSGLSSHASLLLLLCDSLARVLRVIRLVVCMWVSLCRRLVGWFSFFDQLCDLSRAFSCPNRFGERWEGDFGLEDGRRKDSGGSGESRVESRSTLPPVTKTLLRLFPPHSFMVSPYVKFVQSPAPQDLTNSAGS